jgi:hypothetical protein
MTTLDAIALLAAAMKADDTRTTSKMLAFLETRLDLEEIFALLEALDAKQEPPPAKPAPMGVTLCA